MRDRIDRYDYGDEHTAEDGICDVDNVKNVRHRDLDQHAHSGQHLQSDNHKHNFKNNEQDFVASEVEWEPNVWHAASHTTVLTRNVQRNYPKLPLTAAKRSPVDPQPTKSTRRRVRPDSTFSACAELTLPTSGYNQVTGSSLDKRRRATSVNSLRGTLRDTICDGRDVASGADAVRVECNASVTEAVKGTGHSSSNMQRREWKKRRLPLLQSQLNNR